MQIEIKTIINNDINLKQFLKENSYWYKYLNRSPLYLNEIKEDMKKKYQLTAEDKVRQLSDKINIILEILKIIK